MPSITVNGIPAETSQEDLEKIMLAMVKKVQEVSPLAGYHTESVMVWFPSDLMELGLGHEFSIDVACLDRSYGGPPVGIAMEFCEVIAGFFPNYWRIECYIRPFMHRREDGYAVMTQPHKRGAQSVEMLQNGRA